ncbi:MAG: hypothetical protein DRN21_01540, partial [Thermoplasmata archaeon]
TYIHLARPFLYPAVILDADSPRAIGRELEQQMDAGLTLGVLQMALSARSVKSGLVCRFSRGVQYPCDRYTDLTGLSESALSQPSNLICLNMRANARHNSLLAVPWGVYVSKRVCNHHWDTFLQ